ncbi:MAG: hypothetical protein DCC75_10500, partial [Proteobacteria bacterium]
MQVLDASLFKTVHSSSKDAHTSAKRGILADVLSTLEHELQRRGLVQKPALGTHTPLWFIVETEINVCLWRKGLSLENRDNFEFWVDIPRLISKRILQLSEIDPANPFSNPAWGQEDGAASGAESSTHEVRYLEALVQAIVPISDHLEALSEAASMVL